MPRRTENFFANASRVTRQLAFTLCIAFAIFLLSPAAHADALAEFDAANKLYEQAGFAQAAQQYQKLIEAGGASPVLHFNLGNALFKSGQIGRAVYNFRVAQRLAPRDADIRANLEFARRLVRGGIVAETPWWQRLLTNFTIDEFAMCAAVLVWLWFAALALGQWRESLRDLLSGWTTGFGIAACAAVVLVSLAWHQNRGNESGVVIAQEAVVRFGPLEESASAYTLRDGSEVAVLDEKEAWLQVADETHRAGWVRKDQVLIIGRAPATRPVVASTPSR
jgi:tetratricopeptide (TPR) repeat protein